MTDETKGDRIAKVMARAGVASRRDAERLILAGRVAVNGEVTTSPALDVLPTDTVTLDGKPIDAPQPPRLWLYYKPLGLVTSAKDEKGRQTVFESLPDGMPRVMSVGRLDLNSEGLLLLTNDGELKRRLELPATGWLRKYRVRVNGRPNDATFDPLRRGIVIEGEDFQPMDITLDRQQGANAWATVGLREGKNREVRRAMAAVGLTVNRLIRVSYGPFRLNEMKPGDVLEVKAKVMREQLGGLLAGLVPGREAAGSDKPAEGARAGRKPARAPAKGPRQDRGRSGGDRPAAPRGGKPGFGGGRGERRAPDGSPRERGAGDTRPEDGAGIGRRGPGPGKRPEGKPRTPRAAGAGATVGKSGGGKPRSDARGGERGPTDGTQRKWTTRNAPPAGAGGDARRGPADDGPGGRGGGPRAGGKPGKPRPAKAGRPGSQAGASSSAAGKGDDRVRGPKPGGRTKPTGQERRGGAGGSKPHGDGPRDGPGGKPRRPPARPKR